MRKTRRTITPKREMGWNKRSILRGENSAGLKILGTPDKKKKKKEENRLINYIAQGVN
jgi:hypothetical protein